ncbi:unnamed protein product [Rotaria magnacalcarata]|uniref:Ubiquitin-like domain-containing protein n=1 Tax=Rotaria magnacalcarata TaxID=392030 RepID=A0A819ENV4_9BILA|nr:unnamed protein product [Rotaria magnacalcarata]
MSSHLWPTIETSKVSSLWFRPLQTVREDVSLAKFEETLEQERRRHLEKGLNLPFHGRTEMDNGDDDEDGDEAEEESEGGEQDDEMDAQQGPGSPGNGVGNGVYIWTQTLQELEWLTVSSIDGVATIRSLNSTVIILYDKTNQTLADFFASLQAMLVHEPNLALSGSDLLPSNQGIQTGRANIRIKDEKDPGNIRNYSNVKLQLTTGKSDPNLILQLPIDNEVVGRFNLRDCSYLDRSSSRGVVECIRNNSTEEILLILNSTEESAPLLEHMRNYLMAGPEATRGSTPESARRPAPEPARGPSPTPIPAPISNEDVNRLISALNENNTDEASRFARKLASNRAAIQFSLDMINEHGNAAPRQPPKPVIQPLKLKLAIESFLIDQCTDEKYDVAILPETTINDLKQIVYRDTEISVQQQYWFINREHLTDTYTFGVTTPLVNENTVLTLYIAKPQQN